eukprot:gene1819-33237_t
MFTLRVGSAQPNGLWRGFIGLVLLTVISHASAEMYSESDNIVILESAKEYKELVHDTDGLAVVEFFSESCPHCTQLAPQYVRLAKSMQGTVLVAAVDCGNPGMQKVCKKVGVQGLPSIKEVGKESTDIRGRTAKAIVDEISKVLTDEHITVVSSEADLASALTKKPMLPKALLFTSRGDAPNGYKGVSMAFNSGMSFLMAMDTSVELVMKFKIEDFPSLVLIKADGSEELF